MVLNAPRRQANIESKQGRFQLNCYQPFAFKHGSLVYNSRDHDWIPNTTDNPWDHCPGQNPKRESHVIHTLGWSLQLNDITLIFDVKSERVYYGETGMKKDIETGYCPSNYAIKATVIWEPNDQCRIFDVGISNARMIKIQKRNFLETLTDNET